ncbi:FAD-dependent oxidoreductase, partial [Chloroflexota bacterium]
AGVDAIHVTGFGPKVPSNFTGPTFVPTVLAHLAEGIKKAVKVPVIAVGRITPEAGEKIVAEGKTDLVAMAKGLLADPETANKFFSGRTDDICPCILCMGCRNDLSSDEIVGIRCSVNASSGKEGEYKIVPTGKPKKVLVVGGGPAGMEAARVAVLRGHTVTLWERETRLGGQLVQAAIPPHKDRLNALTTFLETQVRKAGVDVAPGKEATAALVEQFQPEVAIIATGVKPFTPDIPGMDKAHCVQAIDILGGKASVGDKVVVIGGELVGCETAEFLAERGKKVTVTRRKPEMAAAVGPTMRRFFLDRLLAKGVILLPGVSYREIVPQGLVVTTREGETKTIEADTIVLAAGAISNNKLYEELRGKVPEVYLVGDSVEPRTIRDAIADGFRVALEL